LRRVSANDLRFWLTDRPYASLALQWARERDLPSIRLFLREDHDGKQIHFLSLETSAGLDEFWQLTQPQASRKSVAGSKQR
jgi:hypothetical protein